MIPPLPTASLPVPDLAYAPYRGLAGGGLSLRTSFWSRWREVGKAADGILICRERLQWGGALL
jgi:hypothetical protein